MRVRRAEVNDIPKMLEIDRQSSSAHWSQRHYLNLFTDAKNESGEREDSLERFAWVAEIEPPNEAAATPGDIRAFIVASKVDADWELENIIVTTDSRRKNIGDRLLRELISYARSLNGFQIWLEVRRSNEVARAFYRSAGFEENGVRNDYYSGPTEDAILYRLVL